jgi:exosortase/archaeosortase family protein
MLCAALLTPVATEEQSSYSIPEIGTLLLTMVGLQSLVCWLNAVMPFQFWTRLLREKKQILITGLTVGTIAFGAGWLAAEAFSSLTRRATLVTVQKMLSLVGEEADCEPENLILGTLLYRTRLLSSASGLQGLGLLWVFLVAYVWLYRHRLRFPQTLLLVPIASFVIWLVNVAWIGLLALIGSHLHPRIAMEMLVSHAGWLVFNLAILAMFAVSSRCGFFMACIERERIAERG